MSNSTESVNLSQEDIYTIRAALASYIAESKRERADYVSGSDHWDMHTHDIVDATRVFQKISRNMDMPF